MKNRKLKPEAQSGIALIEALISILIFSFAVLGLMGIQASAVSMVSSSKSRADAGYLADQIIGQMWSDQANVASYAHHASPVPGGSTAPCSPTGTASGNANVTAWLSVVSATLPGATAATQQIYVGANNLVTVTICWKLPSETATHNFSETAQING